MYQGQSGYVTALLQGIINSKINIDLKSYGIIVPS